jgi:hypothetical protein
MPSGENVKDIQSYQWQKGVSGNPKGKTKGAISMSKRIQHILSEDMDWGILQFSDESLQKLKDRFGNRCVADALVWVQISKALSGDTNAFNALREAGWGRMVNVDASAQLDVVHILKPEKLEIAQLESAAEQLRQRAQSAIEGELSDELDVGVSGGVQLSSGKTNL